MGPCTDVRIPPRTLEVEGSLALHNITGLEEYSQYVVRVTPHGGRLTASVNVTTLSAGQGRGGRSRRGEGGEVGKTGG